MQDMNRREVIVAAVAAVCAGVGCPNCLMSAEPAEPVKVGTLSEFAADGIFGNWAGSHGFFIVRKEGRLYAVSSRCSHKPSVLLKEEKGSFRCPKHKALFAATGALVVKGEAKRPLPRLGITADEKGQLTVDPGRRFESDQWQEHGAYVAL